MSWSHQPQMTSSWNKTNWKCNSSYIIRELVPVYWDLWRLKTSNRQYHSFLLAVLFRALDEECLQFANWFTFPKTWSYRSYIPEIVFTTEQQILISCSSIYQIVLIYVAKLHYCVIIHMHKFTWLVKHSTCLRRLPSSCLTICMQGFAVVLIT